MFEDLPPAVALLIGLILLVKGADWLVDGGVKIARRLGVSPIMIGLTIVAWGTSLPELVVSTLAAAEGRPGLSLGNALGSNVANIGLVLGATGLLLPAVLGKPMRARETGWLFASVAALGVVLLLEGGVGRLGGGLLIGLFLIHNLHLWKTSSAEDDEEALPKGQGVMRKAVALVVVSAVAVALGAELTVNGAEAIARSMGVSDRVIGLSVVAIGTSLPELAAGVASALKGQTEIGIGNVVGSNVFNVIVAVGAAGVVRPFGDSEADVALVERVLWFDLPLVFGFSLAAAVLPRVGPPGRWMGGVLLLGYVAYLYVQF